MWKTDTFDPVPSENIPKNSLVPSLFDITYILFKNHFHLIFRSHELISESKQHNQKETPYSTSRKSSEETAFKWTKMLSMDEIRELENICQKPMAKLGYAKYNGDINNHRDILVKEAKEVWPF